MDQIIIHVDMDAFYASVEIRDDPALAGKPLIIGSLPTERGVVATCSYEARKFGVHSGMSIKDAYRLCPGGVYRHPNFEKYRAISQQLHEIWASYASAAEYIALDEAYLDVTETAGSFETARQFARAIQRRTREELRLSCSVGLAYSKTAAKTASEEKKPAGYFEIPTPEAFVELILDRDVRVLYTVGSKTAERLNQAGIRTVRDIRDHPETVESLLGKQGRMLTELSHGIDRRKVTPYRVQDAKSISRELTFQADVTSYAFLRQVLLLLAIAVERRARRYGLYGRGVSLKITYGNMKSITRSRALDRSVDDALTIYREGLRLLEQVEPRPVRLIGVGLYHVSEEYSHQLSLPGFEAAPERAPETDLKAELDRLGQEYHLDFYGHLEEISHGETLHRTVEYMRKRHAR